MRFSIAQILIFCFLLISCGNEKGIKKKKSDKGYDLKCLRKMISTGKIKTFSHVAEASYRALKTCKGNERHIITEVKKLTGVHYE